MNRLSYWNASQIFDGGLGNRDDMKNIVYMLKHPDIKYKKKNNGYLVETRHGRDV